SRLAILGSSSTIRICAGMDGSPSMISGGQADPQAQAAQWRGAGGDIAVVSFDDPARQRQAEARATELAVARGGFGTVQVIKQPLQCLLRHARCAVFQCHDNALAVAKG